jgi:hypothetical protein
VREVDALSDILIPFALTVGVLAVILVPAVAYVIYWRKVQGPKLWTAFLTQSGYRRVQNPGAPLEQQARDILQDIFPKAGVVKRGPWLRDEKGLPVYFEGTISTRREGSRSMTSFTESWCLKLPAAAPFGMQLVDRKLVDPSLLASAGNALIGRSRSFMARFPALSGTGIPFIDQRFAVFSNDAARAQQVLADATLQGMLHALPEADVRMEGPDITFDDPSGTCRRQVVGLGLVGPTQMLAKEPQVHQGPVTLLRHLAWLVTGA